MENWIKFDEIGVSSIDTANQLVGYDIDGVLTAGITPVGDNWVVISGRTRAEYDSFVRDLATKAPVYIRHTGNFGDLKAASEWKATMVKLLKVTLFIEDDPTQAGFVKINNPGCRVLLVDVVAKNCKEVILTEEGERISNK